MSSSALGRSWGDVLILAGAQTTLQFSILDGSGNPVVIADGDTFEFWAKNTRTPSDTFRYLNSDFTVISTTVAPQLSVVLQAGDTNPRSGQFYTIQLWKTNENVSVGYGNLGVLNSARPVSGAPIIDNLPLNITGMLAGTGTTVVGATLVGATYDPTTTTLTVTGGGGGGGGGVWGSITGTLSAQTDLNTALNARLLLAGGTMTGRIVLGGNTIRVSNANNAIADIVTSGSATATLIGVDANKSPYLQAAGVLLGFDSSGNPTYNSHKYLDSAGKLYGAGMALTGSFSADSGTIQTDGSGNLTASSIAGSSGNFTQLIGYNTGVPGIDLDAQTIIGNGGGTTYVDWSGAVVAVKVGITGTTGSYSGTLTASNLSGTNTGDQTNITGNAATATTATKANGLVSATTTVSVSSATAPTSGQVLTATSTTAATWQNPSGAGGTAAISLTGVTMASNVLVSSLTATGTLQSPTLVTPALGTPSSGTLTSCSGYLSASLTGVTLASNVLVSSLTSVGTLQSPTLVTPALGTPASGVATNLTGTASGMTVGTANAAPASGITGATLASNVLVTSITKVGTLASPALTTPTLGTPTSGTLTSCSGYLASSLSGTTLASSVVNSSLTAVGTLVGLTLSGALAGTSTSLSGNLVTGGTVQIGSASAFSWDGVVLHSPQIEIDQGGGFLTLGNTGLPGNLTIVASSGASATTLDGTGNGTFSGALTASNMKGVANFGIQNSSAVPTGAILAPIPSMPTAGTITGWSITVDAGTCTVEFWKIAAGTALPTVTNTINTSGVSISTGTVVQSTTLTDFTTTTITAGDIIICNVKTISGVKVLSVQLTYKKG